MRSFQTDSTMIWNSKKKDLQTHFLFVSSKTGAAMRIIPGAFGGRPRDTLWSHLVDLELENWHSEEMVPILDYRRNFFFPLNSSFLWIMALNVSGIFQVIFRWQVSWDGRGFMLGIILVKYKVGEGERRNACVCVLSSFFESICMTYEPCVVSPWELGKLVLLFCSWSE